MAKVDKPLTDKRRLVLLFFPILFETLSMILLGVVDTIFIARVSDSAVGAAGTATTYLSMFYLLFAVISSGVLAVMLQYFGSNKKGVAVQARNLAVIFNGACGVILSLVLGFGAPWILDTVGISEALRNDAIMYFRIVGAACIIDALIPLFSSYLRAFDKTRYTLIAGLSANILNIALDALFIFGFQMGVAGAAIATVIGKALNLGLCLLFGKILINGRQYKERISHRVVIRQMVKIGLPGAVEMTAYSLAMSVVMVYLNRMDPTGFEASARSVAAQITSFSYCAAYAFAQANVLLVGWKIGEGDKKTCYKITRFAALVAIGIGVALELLFALIAPWMAKLFANDSQIIQAVRIVLFIDIALEIGRAGNLVYGNTLKSTGDSIYPMIISVIVTSVVVLGGGYLFAVVCKLGVIGAYIALGADECIRVVMIFFRWRSGKWESKCLVHHEKENEAVLFENNL